EACKNAAGEIFDPPPMKDQSMLILTITRNEDILSPHPATALLYQDTVNSDVFWGANAGQVKVANITAQRQTRQISNAVLPYLKVTYVFHFRSPDWDSRTLNAGSYYRETMIGPKIFFKSVEGHPIKGLLQPTSPGDKLPEGDPPNWITVRPYNRLPFSALNLP